MRYFLIALVVVVSSVPVGAPAADKDKKEVQVDRPTKKAVAAFCGALRNNDSEAMMKAVDVPWFHAGKKVIRDRDSLKQEAKEMVQKDFRMAGFYYKNLSRFGDVMGELNEQQRQMAKGVIDKDDKVVTLQVFLPKGGEHTLHLIVRGKGEPKVIGIIEP